eukprot:3759427-Prymnesium_polylepis.1
MDCAVQTAPASRAALAGSQFVASQATSSVGSTAGGLRALLPSLRPDMHRATEPFPTRPHSSRRPTRLRSTRQMTTSSRLINPALLSVPESSLAELYIGTPQQPQCSDQDS